MEPFIFCQKYICINNPLQTPAPWCCGKPVAPELGKSTHFWGAATPQCAVPDLGMTHEISCVRVKEMVFLEAPALGCAIKHITQGQKSLDLSRSWPWDGTFGGRVFKWSHQLLAQPWARSLLQVAPKLVVRGHQSPQLWARPAAQEDWSLMASWDCESQSSAGSSPATNPETQAAATSGRTDKIINFSEKLQHLGSIFHFGNSVYWCVWNRLFLGFLVHVKYWGRLVIDWEKMEKNNPTVFCHLQILRV